MEIASKFLYGFYIKDTKLSLLDFVRKYVVQHENNKPQRVLYKIFQYNTTFI